MVTLLVGSAAVWGLATAVWNWQAGLFIAILVFCGTSSGMRQRREQLHREERAQAARDVMNALYEEPRGWWRR